MGTILNSSRLVALGLLVAMGAMACGSHEKKDTDSDNSDTPAAVSSSGGGGTTTSTTSKLTATASVNIGSVQSQMVPASLALKGASLALTGGENPCAGKHGLFDCQPNLLKLYLNIAQSMLANTKEVVDKAGKHVGELTLPAAGSVEPGDGDAIVKVDYDAKSVSDYQLLLHTEAGAFLNLSVKDSVYVLKADMARASGADGGGELEVDIDYTDSTNFTIQVTGANMPCQEDQLGAPQSFRVDVIVTAGVWQGKAMLYQPRWLMDSRTDSCKSEPTDASKTSIYTDFVGDETNSTLAVYLIPGEVKRFDAIETYAPANFCKNFGICQGDVSPIDASPVADYQNPGCILANGSATWGGACKSTSTKISIPTYSDATRWFSPEALAGYEIAVPETL